MPTLPEITDDFMLAQLGRSKEYAVVVLRDGPNPNPPDRDAGIWEHGRRNFALREAGMMNLVGPIKSGSLQGMCVLNTSVAEAEELLAADPAVQAGILAVDVYSWRSFPGDALAG